MATPQPDDHPHQFDPTLCVVCQGTKVLICAPHLSSIGRVSTIADPGIDYEQPFAALSPGSSVLLPGGGRQPSKFNNVTIQTDEDINIGIQFRHPTIQDRPHLLLMLSACLSRKVSVRGF